MKASLAVLGLFLVTGWAAAAPSPPLDVPKLNSWFSELGPRREGSAAEREVFRALRSWFGSRTAVTEAAFDDLDGEHSFSQRLWFRIEGKRPGELVVVAPTDGENNRGLAWAVAWAQDALDHGTEVSLTFLFTGAERGPGGSAGMGSRAFLQDFYPTAPAAVLYLDASRGPFIELTTESGLFPSPLWMVRGLTEALDGHGLTPRFTGTAPSLFRLDLPERKNALAPWFDRSIPALLVDSGPPSIQVVLALQAFASSLQNGVPSNWDRHYLVFDLGFTRFFWSQAAYTMIFLATTALLLFGYALLGRGRRGSLRVLGRGAWQLPVLFAFLFLTLNAGTVLAGLLQEARGMPDFWKTSPLLVWAFKAFVAVSLYLFLFLPFRRSPLSSDPEFYSQAALLWLGFMVVIAAALELTFSFYFLWALVWCAVLVVVPWPPLRFVAMALGPVWLFKAAWDILGPQPDLALSQWVLVSPVAGNFVLAVLFFPFLLQANAWHFSGRRHQNRDEGLRAAVQLTFWGLSALVLGLFVLQTPAGALPPGHEKAQKIDLNQTPRHDLWSATVTRSAFLDRTVWTVRFTGTAPEHIEFRLDSDEPLTIFDCSFPLTVAPGGREARIVVGRQPPLPLELRLTLPASTKARLKTTLLFEGTPGLEATDIRELTP